MKNFTVRISKLVGPPTVSSWSQIHDFFPDDLEKKQKRGIFLAVLTFSGVEQGIDAVSYGREILSRIHEEYYGEIETSAMEKLVTSVKKVAAEFDGSEHHLEIIAGALVENALYLAISGLGEVLVKRNGQLQKILVGTSEKTESASGFVLPGDLVVFGTEALAKNLADGVLKAALDNETPEEITEVLAPLTIGKEENAQIACLVFRVSEIPESVSEPPPAKKAKFKISVPKINLRRFTIKVSSESTKGRRIAFSIALVLIVLLLTSVFFGITKRGQTEKTKIYTDLSVQIDQKINDGQALVTLNPSKAKELFLSAQQQLDQLKNLKINIPETQQLTAKVEDALGLVVKEYSLSEAPLFFDLGLIKDKASGNQLFLLGKKLVVFDKAANNIYTIDIDQKSAKIAAGKDLPVNSRLIAGDSNFVFTLGDEGIFKTDLSNQTTSQMIKTDSEWGQIKALGDFGGNLYLFDPLKKSIWRYQSLETGFSTKQTWFKSTTLPDFAGAVSMAVDGSIWLLDQNGKIYKFTGGVQGSFSLKGLDKPLLLPAVIYTDSDQTNVYILDKGNNRILVSSKSGDYQGQYIWEGLSGITDFVVTETDKKIFLLQENKILTIELK
ncbi:hypothetical protein COU94_04125 [Candidatus Shapirobacteria bacterium CG10_big_fil_rev_8_21_14_0_10_38_8]|nr:MAG: hypothetical protein COU94_04125 [Candidatus Shapirobacteria bacterium CG10_big_fil_rev_8_21_14_0_10_38_8]